MTGATRFTRRAGLAGLLGIPLALLAVPMIVALERQRVLRLQVEGSSGREEILVYLWFGVIVMFGLTMLAGLVVRHWHHYLTKLAVTVAGGAVALGLVARAGEVAAAGGGVAALLLLLAVLFVGELPRAAAILVLVAEVLHQAGAEWASLVGVVGWAWLAFAMWREPVTRPGEQYWEGNVVATS